jgi:predicted Zn finger-like uncharacterized protein
MHIVCPNCTASYQVSAAAIGAAGRSVRCVRCRSVWHQNPVDEAPPAAAPAPAAQPQPASDATVAAFQSELGNARPQSDAPPPAAAPAPAVSENGAPPGPPLADLMVPAAADPPPADPTPAAEQPAAAAEIAVPAEQAPPLAPAIEADRQSADDIESIAARRRKRSTARRRIPLRSARMPAVILVLIGMVAALIAWRGSIVRHAPQMASLYEALGLGVNLRGLTFTDIKATRSTQDGVSVLMVEGSIVSAASVPVEVPRLRFAMRNEVGSEIYAWTAMPSREVLGPGETLPFRSRLASPPGEGRDVSVRFFTRLDATAGLR